MARRLEIIVPDELWKRIDQICKEYNISINDLILPTLIRVIERFEKKVRR